MWLPHFDAERWALTLSQRNVPQWPRPNTRRVDCKWRWKEVLGWPTPMSSRIVFRFQPYLPTDTTFFYGVVDLNLTSVNHAIGDTGEDADGRKVTFQIDAYDPPDSDPDLGLFGVTWTWRWSRVGFDTNTFKINFQWTVSYDGKQFYQRHQTVRLGGYPWPTFSDLRDLLNPDWTTDLEGQGVEWATFPECYDLS